MSQALPSSASLPSDCALISRYAAARGYAEPVHLPDQDEHAALALSSSPNTLRNYEGRSSRPVPVITRSSASPSSGKERKGSEWRTEMPEDDGVHVQVTETTPLILSEDTGVDDQPEDSDWWTELKILSAYTLPVFGTHIFEYSLSIAPVVSIGHISTNALAAVTLGSMTASVTGFSIIIGFGTALDTMLPAAWTSGTPSLVGLWTLRMTVLMTIILIPIFVLWLNAEEILLVLRQDPEVARLAGVYLRWYSLGMPAYAFNAILRRYFQSQGLFSAPTRILFIVAPINILLNYLLVWGPSWIRLGFIGAPIATAISFNLIAFLYVIYGLFYAPKTAWHPITHQCFHDLKPLFKLGLAGVAQVAAEWWSWELVALAASQIGAVALAVQSVLLVSASCSYQAPYALSAATSVRVGNMLGAQNAKGAALSTRMAILLTMGVALVLSSIFLIFRKNWAYMFNDDQEIVDGVAGILPLVALFQIFDGLGAVTGAILRAKGQQDLGAMLSLVGYYVIGLPSGLFLAFQIRMGLEGLWVGLTIALVVVAIVGLYICTVLTDWEKEVQKTMLRLGQEEERSSSPSTIVP